MEARSTNVQTTHSETSTLKWCSTILTSLNELRQNSLFCDVNFLSEEGTTVSAHACVLAAVSPPLAEQFSAREKQLPVSIPVTSPHCVLEGLMSLVYTGCCDDEELTRAELEEATNQLGISIWPDLVATLKQGQGVHTVSASADDLLHDMEEECEEENRPLVLPKEEEVSGEPFNMHSCSGCLANDEVCREDCQFKRTLQSSLRQAKKQNKKPSARKLSAVHECTRCERRFSTRSKLRGHMKYHVDSKLFACSECPSTFRQNRYLEKHMLCHAEDKPFQCSICGICFPRADTLKAHQRVHSDITPFLCGYCGKKFKCKSSLLAHEKFHADQSEHVCEICKETFTKGTDLKVHILKCHTPDCPYRCPQCKKFYNGKEALRRHERVHTGERPYQCELCSAAFKQSGQLTVHKLIHSDERPFKCSHGNCSMSFKTNVHLRRHLRVHNNDRPYKCLYPNCGLRYNASDHLKIHQRTHSGERPYVCSYCAKSFSCSSNLRSHERTHCGEKARKSRGGRTGVSVMQQDQGDGAGTVDISDLYNDSAITNIQTSSESQVTDVSYIQTSSDSLVANITPSSDPLVLANIQTSSEPLVANITPSSDPLVANIQASSDSLVSNRQHLGQISAFDKVLQIEQNPDSVPAADVTDFAQEYNIFLD